MTLLLILTFLIMAALVLVSIVNQVQRRERARRMQLRQLRLRLEALEEIIHCLIQTLPNREIAKQVNKEILELLQEMSRLEAGTAMHIEASIKNAQSREEELDSRKGRHTSYQKESDAQIAQTQTLLNQTIQVLRRQHNRGKISDEEMDIYLNDLSWATLMVSVASLIGQGNKANARGDLYLTHAFYKKAQHILIESVHPEPKRMRLIRELGEVVGGSRKTVSEDLLPKEAATL